MTDESKVEKVEEVVDQSLDQTPEPTPSEVEARKLGWRPEAEFEGEEGKWVNADEFIARAPLFEKNRKLSRKIKDLESSVNLLKDHHSKVEEAAYKRAIDTLKAEKIKALDEGDHKSVVDIDEQIIDLKKEAKKEKTADNPEFDEWKSRNSWYETDKELKEFADIVGYGYAATHGNPDKEEVYKYTEDLVRSKFPEKFMNPNKRKPSAVESGSRDTGKQRRPSWSELPEIFQQVGGKFVRNGVMTRDQYIDDLIKTGDIKA